MENDKKLVRVYFTCENYIEDPHNPGDPRRCMYEGTVHEFLRNNSFYDPKINGDCALIVAKNRGIGGICKARYSCKIENTSEA